jgi:hypothetical protein
MGRNMALDFGLEKEDVCYKRKFRWLFKVEDLSAQGVNALPPSDAARPKISFNTTEIQGLNEIITRPIKPVFDPIKVTLYDIKKRIHPVFDYLKKIYDASTGDWKRSNDYHSRKASRELYDGCGEIIETWIYENVWIEEADFGDLAMDDSGVVVVDINLRFDRAYIKDGNSA